MSLLPNDYPTRAQRGPCFDEAVARLAAVPGVTSAAVATALPLEGDIEVHVLSLENDPRPDAERPPASIRYVSPGYFAAVGTSGTVLDHGDIVSPDFEAWGDLG